MEALSPSHEDYLEAMVMLGGDKVAVRSVDVAEKLGVSKTSVSKAVAVLKEKGYVEQTYYGSINLTDEGRAYGRKVLDRHVALTNFLEKAVGLEPDVAEAEACLMEHAISDDSFEKWMVFIRSLNL